MNAQVQINRVGLLGKGVGSDSTGNIYFVPGTVPGDVVRVEYDASPKKYHDAVLVEILTPSSERVEPMCNYFGQCGGCDFQNFRYETQLTSKESILKHVIEKGQYGPRLFRAMEGASVIYGYRNRIQLRQAGNRLGFFRKRSHELIDIDKCAVADDRLNAHISTLRNSIEPEGKDEKIELYIREDGHVERISNAEHSRDGFLQIHPAQNQKLKTWVTHFIRTPESNCVVELFCGAGNLTTSYAKQVKQIWAIDSNPHSIASAKTNTLLDLNCEFSCERIDLNFVKTVLYISCSPISFSKDIGALKKEGFCFEELIPIDMFPHTRHIECIGYFTR